MGKSSTYVNFCLVDVRFVHIILGATIVEKFIKSIYLGKMKIVIHSSRLVPILILYKASKEAKKEKSEISQDVEEDLVLVSRNDSVQALAYNPQPTSRPRTNTKDNSARLQARIRPNRGIWPCNLAKHHARMISKRFIIFQRSMYSTFLSQILSELPWTGVNIRKVVRWQMRHEK